MFYLWLLEKSSEEESVQLGIINNILGKMHTLPQQMKVNPMVAETTMLAFLHMMRQIVCVAPVKDTDLVKKSLSVLQQFYLWPRPFSDTAYSFLQLLHKESMAPGAGLRLQIEKIRKVGGIPSTRINRENVRPIYYLWEKACENSRKYNYIMALRPRSDIEKAKRAQIVEAQSGTVSGELSATTKAMILLNTMTLDPDVGSGNEDGTLISNCSEDQV